MRIRRLGLAGAFLLCLLALPYGHLAAQEPTPPDTVVADTVPPDLGLSRSPRGAFIRSLIVPGWGQAWVGAPGRGGVYFAMEIGSLWMVYKSAQKLREARLAQAWLRESGQLQPNQTSPVVQSREEQREDWITVAVFLLLFSGLDAYVSAHLADFDERIGVAPTADGGLRLQATVPVGRPR